MRVAAAAESLQSCPTLCDPIDGSPPSSPVPGILQAQNTGVACHKVFIEPFKFSFFSISGWNIDLDYCDIEWFFWKRTEIIVIFEIASKYCILDSFVDYEGYSIFLKGFLPTGLDIMVI